MPTGFVQDPSDGFSEIQSRTWNVMWNALAEHHSCCLKLSLPLHPPPTYEAGHVLSCLAEMRSRVVLAHG